MDMMMMNRGLETEKGPLSTTRPALGYLIQVLFSKKQTLPGAISKGSQTQDMEGLDIYRLPHGTTLADARNPTNLRAEYDTGSMFRGDPTWKLSCHHRIWG